MTHSAAIRTARTPRYRLDQTGNPLAPSLRVLEALSNDELYHNPPRNPAGSLIERLAAMEGVPPQWIVLGNGVDDLIGATLRAFAQGDNLVLFPPTDLGTAHLAARLGIEPVLVPRSGNLALDLDRDGLPAFPPMALSVIQHPNDPTGTVTSVQEAVRLVRRSRLLLVDERHHGYGARTLLPLVREFDRIAVLRSFETWAGLAAFPVAYLIAPVAVAVRVRAEQLVSVPVGALMAAHATLDDMRAIESAVIQITDEKARLHRMLRKLNMLRPLPGAANFVLCMIERGDVLDIRDGLLERGIAVHAPDLPGLEATLRISATSHDATAALRAALIELAGHI